MSRCSGIGRTWFVCAFITVTGTTIYKCVEGKNMTARTFTEQAMNRFCREIFVSLGFSDSDASIAAESLVRAELEGAGSHGVSRLSIYAKRVRDGRISAQPDI